MILTIIAECSTALTFTRHRNSTAAWHFPIHWLDSHVVTNGLGQTASRKS